MPNPNLRTKSIGSKVTDEEYASLEKLAQSRGLTLSEWSRETMLAQLTTAPAKMIDRICLEEVLGLRMILLNAIFALANGQRLGQEEMRELLTKVDAEKLVSASERLRRVDT